MNTALTNSHEASSLKSILFYSSARSEGVSSLWVERLWRFLVPLARQRPIEKNYQRDALKEGPFPQDEASRP